MSDSPDDSPQETSTSRSVPLAVDLLGWYGTLAILGAYAASSFEWLERGALYQSLNLTGAFGVGLVCWYRRTWQAFWLEAVWGGIALVALLRAWL